jgi:hypothetical protein
MILLTTDQHQNVLLNLHRLGRDQVSELPFHSAGPEYTSLMIGFLLQNLQCAGTLLRLVDTFTNEHYPVDIGFTIAGKMFETDVTAHYVSQYPIERTRDYLAYSDVLVKQRMDAYARHCKGKHPESVLSLGWKNYWAKHQRDVNRKFLAVADRFRLTDRDGRRADFSNWSGLTLQEMAATVQHNETFDIFMAELAAVKHVDISLADRFLQPLPDGQVWFQSADDLEVCNVFRHAATFFTCFLKLFGQQLNTWTADEVQGCWEV